MLASQKKDPIQHAVLIFCSLFKLDFSFYGLDFVSAKEEEDLLGRPEILTAFFY